jgi:uncharacterized SAM-binding protein YcdF (DUF218 family)
VSGLLLHRRLRIARATAWVGLPLVACSTQAVGAWPSHTLEAEQVPLDAARLAAAMKRDPVPAAVVVLGGGAARDRREQPWSEVLNAATLVRLMYGVHLGARAGAAAPGQRRGG